MVVLSNRMKDCCWPMVYLTASFITNFSNATYLYIHSKFQGNMSGTWTTCNCHELQ